MYNIKLHIQNGTLHVQNKIYILGCIQRQSGRYVYVMHLDKLSLGWTTGLFISLFSTIIIPKVGLFLIQCQIIFYFL